MASPVKTFQIYKALFTFTYSLVLMQIFLIGLTVSSTLSGRMGPLTQPSPSMVVLVPQISQMATE